jgi:hypothetical protein
LITLISPDDPAPCTTVAFFRRVAGLPLRVM